MEGTVFPTSLELGSLPLISALWVSLENFIIRVQMRTKVCAYRKAPLPRANLCSWNKSYPGLNSNPLPNKIPDMVGEGVFE